MGGQWKNGMMHGEGWREWPDGSFYEGQWEDGKMHGEGDYHFPDGDVHQSQWKDGIPHGQGFLIEPRREMQNLPRQQLSFKDGRLHGRICVTILSELEITTIWENGEYVSTEPHPDLDAAIEKRIEESMMEGVPKDRETALLDLTFSARSCLVDLVRRMATSFANRWESDY